MASKAIGFLNFKFGADLKGFDRAMKKAQKNLKKFGKNIQRTGENLTTGLTLPILGLGAASLKLASDFEETDSKFKSIFSSIQTEAEETAKVLSDSFGLSELSAKQLLSNTGSLLVGFGFTEKAALELSEKVNKLAVDLASFTNFSGGAEGASRALTKALLGERESLKSLDIAITETDLKEFAAEHGLVWKELDRITKAQLTYQLALQQSLPAVGDFEKTQAGFANQVRITKGELTDAAVSLGKHLLPMAQKAIGVFRGLVDRFNALSVSTKESIVKWGLLVAAIGPALILFGKISLGVSSLIGTFAILRNSILLASASFNLFISSMIRMTTAGWAANGMIGAMTGAFRALTAAMARNPIGAVVTLLTSAAAGFFLLETNTKGATAAQKEFNGATESTQDAIKRLSKSVGNMGKDTLQLQIEEVKGLIKQIKGAGDLSQQDQRELKQLNGLLIVLKQNQKKAKEEADELAKSLKNVGNVGGDTKKEYKALNIQLAHTKKINEDLIPKKSIKSFEEISGWVTKLTFEQQLFNASMGLFGDVLTSSLDSALNSQENFFDAFVKNIKKAIQSLLIQLAVMTLIQSLTGGGTAAFSILNIKENLGSLLNIPKMADGGIVTGPTTALIGEAGPEAVIPLDQLKNFGGAQQVEVVGKISGTDIFLSNRNTGTNRQRSV